MTFQSRLHAAMKAGDMSVADMAHWFDRPYASVRYWLYGDTRNKPALDFEPRGAQGRLAFRNLQMLEWAIRHNVGFPIPAHLGDRERPGFVKEQRRAVSLHLPENSPAA